MLRENGPVQTGDGDKGPRKIYGFKLMFLTFFMVTGGPNGVEGIVQAGGGFYALVGLLGMAILYALPQALMSAELSTMMPEDGGYILWVRRAFGDFGGWINSWNSLFCNLVDNALYPILFRQYFSGSSLWSPSIQWLVELVVVGLVLITNILGIEVVAVVSMLISVVLCVPFLIQFFWRLPEIDPATQWSPYSNATSACNETYNQDWGSFSSQLIWLYTGWDGIGTFAGQVGDPGTSYPRGVFGAIILITAANIIPVISGLTYTICPKKWDDGYFTTFGDMTAPFLGHWISIGACLANLGLYNANMAESSRALWAMARDSEYGSRQLPSFFGYSSKRFGTPIVAIIGQSIAIGFLLTLDFRFLLQVDTAFNGISLLLEFGTFIVLRHREPDAERPYKVPGGLAFVWCMTLLKVVFICTSFAFFDWKVLVTCAGLNVVFCIMYGIIKLVKRYRTTGPSRRSKSRRSIEGLEDSLING